MAINTSAIQDAVQSQINAITDANSVEDFISVAISVSNVTTDIESSISLGCQLPDLNLGTVPVGTVVYVDELAVPVVATAQSWIGLDGRTYRKDVTFDNLYGTGNLSGNGVGAFTTPTREFTSSTNWVTTSAASSFASAIKDDGTLWSWGCNASLNRSPWDAGQLGDGTVVTKYTPVRERSSSTNWSLVSGGIAHSNALKTDGSLWGWGANNYGQLATGVRASYVYSDWAAGVCSPVREVTNSTNWCFLDAGLCHTAAIKTDGTIWAWGRNLCGSLGTNNLLCYSSPAREASSSTNWKFVSAGGYVTGAIKTSGEFWSWGFNGYGQFGNNAVGCSSSPVQEITSSTNWCTASSGGSSSLIIKTDGTLWSTGRNTKGELGLGGSIPGVNRSSPTQEITSSTTWCLVSANFTSSIAIKTDGSLWSWGANYSGRLGTGNTTCYNVPVREVLSSSGWITSSLGGSGFVGIIRE